MPCCHVIDVFSRSTCNKRDNTLRGSHYWGITPFRMIQEPSAVVGLPSPCPKSFHNNDHLAEWYPLHNDHLAELYRLLISTDTVFLRFVCE